MEFTTTVKLIILYFIPFCQGHDLRQSPIVGIIGGHSVDIEDAPFMASLLLVNQTSFEEEMACGGTIIHNKFILTAAHCVEFRSGYPYNVRVGSSHLFKGELHHVEKYISHELFEAKNEEYDVGLLKLSEPLNFGPNVGTIKLADVSFKISPGLAANVTGWGMTATNHFEPSQKLQQLTMTIPSHGCGNGTREGMICINTANYTKGFCHGDSGGPLTVGDLQIGIVSNGPACFGWTNAYVKVAPHLQWIRNKIIQNL